MKLILPRASRERIEAEARRAFPGECCGLIAGRWREEIAEALKLHPARNIAASNDRFEIHPEDHFAAFRAARRDGHTLIGCYHSHPNGVARPSATDQAGAGEDGFLWLIAALTAAEGPVTITSFAYSATEFSPVSLDEPVGADLVTSSE